MNKVSLSLSGGGAKAICYFGFIRGLESQNIQIDHLFAHSGGAVVLTFMSSGKSDQEVINHFSQFKFRNFLSLNPILNGSFYNTKKIENYYKRISNNIDIADFPYKTCIVTSDLTDWNNPRPVFNFEGNLAQKTIQSQTIPPLFPLYNENGRLYADGAFTSRYGAAKMRELGAEFIIGLYPNATQDTYIPQIFKGLAHTIKSLISIKDNLNCKNEIIDIEIDDFEVKIPLNGFKYAQIGFDVGFKRGVKVAQIVKKL